MEMKKKTLFIFIPIRIQTLNKIRIAVAKTQLLYLISSWSRTSLMSSILLHEMNTYFILKCRYLSLSLCASFSLPPSLSFLSYHSTHSCCLVICHICHRKVRFPLLAIIILKGFSTRPCRFALASCTKGKGCFLQKKKKLCSLTFGLWMHLLNWHYKDTLGRMSFLWLPSKTNCFTLLAKMKHCKMSTIIIMWPCTGNGFRGTE